MDVRVTPLSEGSVHVRTSGGALLVGVTAARLSYYAQFVALRDARRHQDQRTTRHAGQS